MLTWHDDVSRGDVSTFPRTDVSGSGSWSYTPRTPRYLSAARPPPPPFRNPNPRKPESRPRPRRSRSRCPAYKCNTRTLLDYAGRSRTFEKSEAPRVPAAALPAGP
jgi:hypothetical protein